MRAMNGTSTPRQIASRVQKYFEQLMFGVEGSCDIFSSLLVQSTSIPRIQKIDLKFPRPAHKNRHRSLGPDLVSFPSVVVVGPTDRQRFKIHCRTTTRTSGAFGRQNHPSSHSVTNGNTFTGAPILRYGRSDAQNVVSDLPRLTNPTRQPSPFDDLLVALELEH